MRATSLIRQYLLTLFWPITFYALASYWPQPLQQWPQLISLALLAMVGSGFLVSALFSQWRISCAFVLITLIGLALQVDGMPKTLYILGIFTLPLLPWIAERGINGGAPMLTAVVTLGAIALWLRGGAMATLADQLLNSHITLSFAPLAISATDIPVTAALATLAFMAAFIRLTVLKQTIDLAIVGTLIALVPLLWLIDNNMLNPEFTLAALSAGTLTLWSSLLLHAWRMAYMDTLTGLANRRALDQQLNALPRRWSIAMLDVDHFKKFNDNYGHDVGDQVLRRVATAIMAIGQRGRAFRYGGEEFAVLFPYEDNARASKAIEAVRQDISSTLFQVRKPGRATQGKNSNDEKNAARQRGKRPALHGQKITVSGGLASANGDNPKDTFKRADQALYKAKEKGRNRLICAR